MFRRSRELENALALLSEMGPKVAALEQENQQLRSEITVYKTGVGVDDPLTRQSFTFAQQANQIDDLQAEVTGFRTEVETQNGVIRKANEEKAAALAARDEMRSQLKPMEEDRNRLQVQVRELQQELAAVTAASRDALAVAQARHDAQTEKYESALARTTRERDIFAEKLQQSLAQLTSAIGEIQSFEVDDDT